VLEIRLRKLLGNLDRRIHVTKRRRENQLIAALCELANHALGVGALRHVFHVLGDDLAIERLFHFPARGVVL
jgi:hypothetical protein